MQMVPVSGGAQLATESFGVAQRGTILLVMGATASMVWWPDALCHQLAEGGYRVIRYDHRDTGQSTTAPPGALRYDLADMTDDIFAVLDAYGADAAHLVGMSLGGLLAQHAAARMPQRVLSLTLIAAEPLGLTYAGEGMSPALMAHFGTLGTLDWSDAAAVEAALLETARLCAGSAVPFDIAAARTRIRREMQRSDSLASAFNHGMLSEGLDPELTARALRQPTLVVHGSEDPVIAVAAGAAIVAAVPGADLLVLQGRGHEITEEDIPTISAAMLELCDRAG